MRLLETVEHAVKGPIWDCRMCGQCVLHSTGMTCPMTCPKTLRNGPCGGVREDGNRGRTSVRYPNGDECNYLHVWFHCRPVGGAARADGDESLEVAWFERPALPDLDGWSRLRLGSPDGWFAAAGAPPHPGLTDPYAL